MSGIGSHAKPNNGTDEVWLTPIELIHALGPFDLDPCACAEPRPWATARDHFTEQEDGLSLQWYGRVWLNPPYGEQTAKWMERMARHRYGIALIFARTETDVWSQYIWPFANSVLFLTGRITFRLPDGTRAKGNAGGPSALIAYTALDRQKLIDSKIKGALVHDWRSQ